jgi:hypothetical protein
MFEIDMGFVRFHDFLGSTDKGVGRKAYGSGLKAKGQGITDRNLHNMVHNPDYLKEPNR